MAHLESCRSAKVIHRDINLTNVMFPGRWGGRLRAMLIDMTRSLLIDVDNDQKQAKYVGRGESMVSTFAYASKWSLRGYQQGPRMTEEEMLHFGGVIFIQLLKSE
ncbi:unnamed protein product [Vitrella brassicaformis CCMP3155]|uniref:Protein kinase domain-containing protein n=1 Tax=Vitrella brassicaformis (strain CCMP3155) TaxID=1169540 RepID=A0A0G4H006_VITBC|nr:unnamed protein product [Vitrella brassicaformis CCMP3155]|eukprot:CEM36822.1 unnamed protein product [Vitrella brassicaformis CCMP3155]